MRLYLIRHGETDHNHRRILQGHTDVPLNATGLEQAERLAHRMAGVGLDAIYSSDVWRAAMTARVLSERTGLPVEFDPLWRERNPGDLVGKSYEECMDFFLAPDYEPPGGESLRDFDERIRKAAAGLARREAGADRHVAVVSHGMACASFLRLHFPDPARQSPVLRWQNTSVTIADHSDGRWELVSLADTSHLEPDPAASPDPTLVGG